jgi:basic membrane protein A
MVDISPLTDNNAPEAAEAIALARDLMVSGEWDVFSGTALRFSGEAGSVTVEQVSMDLVDNENNIIVAGGEPSVGDDVIQGSMNYYVAGVVDES